MIDLRTTEKTFLASHVKKGGTVVDFTMGNGYDTEWFSHLVGSDGHVYAFDIQAQAIKNTEERLKASGCPENYTLILDSHSQVKEYVKEPICAGMFNLGWLPGSDKQCTTLRKTTLPAVKAAVELLEPDGGLLIAVYPGHEEGRLEGEMLTDYFAEFDRHEITVSKLQIVNSPSSPFFFLVEKKG